MIRRLIRYGFRLGYQRARMRYKKRMANLAMDSLLIIHEVQRENIELMCYVRELERTIDRYHLVAPPFHRCGNTKH